MLPVIDKPLIQYGVEEVMQSGTQNIIRWGINRSRSFAVPVLEGRCQTYMSFVRR
jgi:dTDP-glucose pyrophosphorylase